MKTSNTKGGMRGLSLGFLAGVIGALFMAAYAMLTSIYQPIGFFTPIYHIAAVFLRPKAMDTSMTQALQGQLAYFTFVPAIVGASVHILTGGMAGAIFGVSTARWRLTRSDSVLAGAGFGLFVMAVNSFVLLPIVSRISRGGDLIAHMGSKVGWEHFGVEHLIFGAVLGIVISLLLERSSRAKE